MVLTIFSFHFSLCAGAKDEVEIASCVIVSSDALVVVNGIQFEQDVEMCFASEMNDLRQVYAEHGGFVEIVFRENTEL